jgi:hypothetical protein
MGKLERSSQKALPIHNIELTTKRGTISRRSERVEIHWRVRKKRKNAKAVEGAVLKRNISAKAKTSPIAPTAKPNNICKMVFRVALLVPALLLAEY